MTMRISRTATSVRHAYAGPVPRVTRDEAQRNPTPPRAPAAGLGYAGLQQTLAHLPAAPWVVPTTLLTAVIHTMGGAATSVARGLYVNTSI